MTIENKLCKYMCKDMSNIIFKYFDDTKIKQIELKKKMIIELKYHLCYLEPSANYLVNNIIDVSKITNIINKHVRMRFKYFYIRTII